MEDVRALADADDAELIACHDPVTEVAEETAARFGSRPEPSTAALLTRPDVNAVIIATPHVTHEALLTEALAAGKHVLLERPLAQSLSSALRIATRAQAARCTPGAGPARPSRLVRSASRGVATTYISDKSAAYVLAASAAESPRNEVLPGTGCPADAASDRARLGRRHVNQEQAPVLKDPTPHLVSGWPARTAQDHADRW
ncbi:Gfo/Idh/MocA family protein [Streptomyces achromogenes]|uniref:Gfo/Idh/MocA family protein n=1 Tax=Streptomyces achromogenes TaxID=67255 RepID=UPI003F4D3D73